MPFILPLKKKSFPSSPQHISQISLAITGSCVLALAARGAGRESFGHNNKSPYQEVGLAGKEKGIRNGFE